jgi:4-hydroxybenzoyl-CoA reductase subunit beta
MLTLPAFEWARPRTVEETLATLSERPGETLVIAGGTDAVPNLKHRLHEPRMVVHIGGVRELHFVRDAGDGLHLGALVTLAELSRHPVVLRDFPSLAKAAGLVAGPQLRNMGTLGGNLCLDTRCTYYNQTHFWRSALGYCLKKDGTVCHVVPAGKRCVAAHSSDVAPVLISLGAQVEIAGRTGRRTIAVDEFFVPDGIHNNVLAPGELVVRIFVPARARGMKCGYQKLRPRACDRFPDAVGGVRRARGGRNLRARGPGGERDRGAAARDQRGGGAGAAQAAGRESAEALAQAAYKQCHPLINVPYDHDYRREMVPVFVRRAVREAFTETES